METLFLTNFYIFFSCSLSFVDGLLNGCESYINLSSTNAWQVQIYLSEVLDWYSDLKSQQKWEERTSSHTRKKLLSALEGISAQNAELLLKHLPSDALYEERAILLGKINQHQLALSLYVHKVL